jgi:hypothetical protein
MTKLGLEAAPPLSLWVCAAGAATREMQGRRRGSCKGRRRGRCRGGGAGDVGGGGAGDAGERRREMQGQFLFPPPASLSSKGRRPGKRGGAGTTETASRRRACPHAAAAEPHAGDGEDDLRSRTQPPSLPAAAAWARWRWGISSPAPSFSLGRRREYSDGRQPPAGVHGRR